MRYQVTGLYYYPVKSFQKVSAQAIELDQFGFKYDRRFMLVDDTGRFVTQRKHPLLSQFAATLMTAPNGSVEAIEISGPGFARTVSLSELTKQDDVVVWGDEVNGLISSPDALAGLSDLLGLKVRLAYMPDSSFRQVDRDFFDEDQRVSFADAFPVLLTNEASLADLNGRLSDAIEMSRFRPNIVISGQQAFEEDDWQQLRIGEVVFDCVKPCSRCIMTTIDKDGNKAKNQEPLVTLATYRKNEYGVCFGENLVQRNTGVIKIGDPVDILK